MNSVLNTAGFGEYPTQNTASCFLTEQATVRCPAQSDVQSLLRGSVHTVCTASSLYWRTNEDWM